MTEDLASANSVAERLNSWLVATALPLWSTAGFDSRRGRFCERLDGSGRPIESEPHRAMVQARQIYVFAHAAHLGWFPDGARLAEIAMRSLLREFREPSSGLGGFALSVDVEGRVVSGVRDAYAQAFVLFALAWLYRVTGDPKLVVVADETIAFIESSLVDARHAGLFDAFPISGRSKRQNPHMHLLEAYLALERSCPGRGYIERASSLVDLFRSRMFSARHGVLLEYFAEDWGPHPDELKSRIVEPGHHFEWVWLLREFEVLSGQDTSAFASRLDTVARAHGTSEKGLVLDELDADMSVLKRSHRIWPHAEAAKAAVARHLLGDGEARGFAAAMVSALFETFLDRPFAGGWIDHVDADLRPLVDYVPASTLYHLFCAAAELARGFAAGPGDPCAGKP